MPGTENGHNYLIVSIDVEEDMPNWQIEETTTIRNIEGIPRLQELFDKYGIRPTYLLNYPYATDEKAIEYFKGLQDRCEIGAHMHPWNTPPLTEGESKIIEYPSNLTYEKQFDKIKTVTDALTSAFGTSPVSYRSGKFGMNEDTIDILGRLGYRVDSSVSPMVSWKKDNGPSFLDYNAKPFWWNRSGVRVMEVPVTTGLSKNIPEIFEKIYLRIPRFTKIRGLLSKDHLNIMDFLWLYPAMFSGEEMIALADVMIKKSINVFNVFFHSSEIKSGESIYTRTEKELTEYFSRLDLFFDYVVNEKGMKSVTLSEYRNHHVE